MKSLTVNFPSAEDHARALRQIKEQIRRGNGNQLAGASASILLCALSRADSVTDNTQETNPTTTPPPTPEAAARNTGVRN